MKQQYFVNHCFSPSSKAITFRSPQLCHLNLSCLMASIIIFIFSYESLLCTEWPTGIEGRLLPLWRRTALKLNLDESIKSRQSRGMWFTECWHETINISTSNKALSILKNWTRSSYLLQYTEFLTFSFRSFHCCSLETNSSALHFGKSRSLIRSFNSSCIIRWNSLG